MISWKKRVDGRRWRGEERVAEGDMEAITCFFFDLT